MSRGQMNKTDLAVMDELGRSAPRTARWVIFIVTVFVGLGAFWAAVTDVPGLARANGQLTAQGPLRRVEHLEGGVVDQILLREGQVVEAGQVLVVLDPVALDLQLQQLTDRRKALDSQRARLEFLLADLPGDPDAKAPALEQELQLQLAQMALRNARRRAAADAARELEDTVQTMQRISQAVARRVVIARDRLHTRSYAL